MAITHNLGFPRIGKNRELKFALEKFWRGETEQTELEELAINLRSDHWDLQSKLDYVSVGDFSFYDQVLDTSVLLGNIPNRFKGKHAGTDLDNYFRMARGRSRDESESVHAGEMTKWFDTNYHYIVPEFDADTHFELNAEKVLQEVAEAQSTGRNIKPVIIGPVTYLWLGKLKDQAKDQEKNQEKNKLNKLDLLDDLLTVYAQLLNKLAEKGVEWIQVDEPALVLNLSVEWQHAFEKAYFQLKACPIKILLTTYFGQLTNNLVLACKLPVAGLHVDAIHDTQEITKVIDWLPDHKVLSLGIINGRNIWKTDLNILLDWLEPIYAQFKERLWLAPSCSLLHVPFDLASETQLDGEIRSWLAFALQKLQELDIVSRALKKGRPAVAEDLKENALAIVSRKTSSLVHKADVQSRLIEINDSMGERNSRYSQRTKLQAQQFDWPLFPTTTIGSFPQTKEIRQVRQGFKTGKIDQANYKSFMQSAISHAILEQEKCGLDVLVHGEAERNDMVEYFGELISGYAITESAWVQSYGSRCVKPPIIYGDVVRENPMTVEWTEYAQTLTEKPVKGMLTGPVTLLNWSFVRDDQPRSETCLQLALAVRDEVQDLEKAGVKIIQIDEAALREGLPLREEGWSDYLGWAIKAFRLAANGVKDTTQIHTHMCYSEFNDIFYAIADMDADVISIETSRSDNQLLNVFEEHRYANEIGPGVYDIHSPNIPEIEDIVKLIEKAAQHIPAERLWINPDCGLKTRQWEEVKPALHNMVKASKVLRRDYNWDRVEKAVNQ